MKLLLLWKQNAHIEYTATAVSINSDMHDMLLVYLYFVDLIGQIASLKNIMCSKCIVWFEHSNVRKKEYPACSF